MADKKITDLPATALVNQTDLFEKVDGVSGFSEKASIQQIQTSILSIPSGTVAAPSISFLGDPDTGISSAGSADKISLSVGGLEIISCVKVGANLNINFIGGSSYVFTDGITYSFNFGGGESFFNELGMLVVGSGALGGTEVFRADPSVSSISFFANPLATQQISGANLTNNVTSGGTDDTVDNVVASAGEATAADLATTRDAIYQLSRKLKQVNDALRAYGMLT